MLKLVENESENQNDGSDYPSLDAIAREGARRMLMDALDVEVMDYLSRHHEARDERGHALVVRNGVGKERTVTVGSGTFGVKAPRVHDKRAGHRFTSQILPPYMRKSPKVAEVLPVLYLRGLSTGDFKEALRCLLGDKASGLSPSSISRLTDKWSDDYRVFRNQSLKDKNYLYVWADGIHFNVRLEDERLCTLVLMGALPDGTKEPIAIEDGFRESTESWSSVLRDLKRRGLRPPLLAIGDGALGFWAAVREVWPETKEQRCWVHKIANVLDKLPKSLQGKAKRLLHEIMNAPTRKESDKAIKRFSDEFRAKYLKAVETLTKDKDALQTLYDFPAEQWQHIRTTNPIESTFATVRLRQRVTKGAGSRNKALLMAFKLIEMASKRWRRLRGYRLMQRLVEGAKFEDGIEIKQEEISNESNKKENHAA